MHIENFSSPTIPNHDIDGNGAFQSLPVLTRPNHIEDTDTIVQ